MTKKRQKMNLKQRFREWYIKPRKGAMFRFMDWVVNDGRAFILIMEIGTWVTLVVFNFLFYLQFAFGTDPFFKVLFGIIAGLTWWRLYKFYKNKKAIVTLGTDLNIAKIMKTQKGETDGNARKDTWRSYWKNEKQSGKLDTAIAERVRQDCREPKSADVGTCDDIQCYKKDCSCTESKTR